MLTRRSTAASTPLADLKQKIEWARLVELSDVLLTRMTEAGLDGQSIRVFPPQDYMSLAVLRLGGSDDTSIDPFNPDIVPPLLVMCKVDEDTKGELKRDKADRVLTKYMVQYPKWDPSRAAWDYYQLRNTPARNVDYVAGLIVGAILLEQGGAIVQVIPELS